MMRDETKAPATCHVGQVWYLAHREELRATCQREGSHGCLWGTTELAQQEMELASRKSPAREWD